MRHSAGDAGQMAEARASFVGIVEVDEDAVVLMALEMMF
jgi:hypothetical protein